MHRSSGLNRQAVGSPAHSVGWEDTPSLDSWLSDRPLQQWRESFQRDGYLVVEDLLSPGEVARYAEVYNKLISGEINATAHRHDLGNHVERKTAGVENVCQIMWPQLYVQGLAQGPLHARSQAVARHLLGDDMTFDFDMMIYKAPHTDTETPWHQDESYWPDLPDKRSVSCWVALDEATVDNGCMWFVPGSFRGEVRPHRPVAPGVHILMCDSTQSGAVAAPLKPGSCTFHHGRTLHHTHGNTTHSQRRAYITNFRPCDMVAMERSLGFDHGKQGVDGVIAKGTTHESAQQPSV